MSDLNREIARKAFDHIWNNADFAMLDQIYAADYIHRGNGFVDTVGLEPLKQVVRALHAAFPDGRFTVEPLVSEADTVVVRWRFNGTHRGEWLGVPATGKPVDFTGTSVVRLAGGKIGEQLSADWDSALLYQQLGVLGDPAAMEVNKALCRAWLEVFNAVDPVAVDQIVSADFLYQATGLPEIRGGEKIKELIRSLHRAFPDGRFVLEENVATAEGGVNRWSFSGTHQGEWMGFAPTGKVVRFTGSTWVRTSGGKIVYQWCEWDVKGMLEQLGSSGAAEANKALVRRYMEEVWNQGNLEVIDEIFAADSHFCAPHSAEFRGVEARKEFVAGLRAAFPDTHYTIDDLTAEGFKVTLRWSYEGTHRGEWFGIAPTGKVIRTSGTSTFRIAGGKILDEFVQWDALSYMQQLGVVPAPGQFAGAGKPAAGNALKGGIEMSLQDAFEGAKAAMTNYGGFFKDVANEIGLERALALHGKRGEGFAAALSAATKERLDGRKLDLSTFGAVYREMGAKGFGMAGETAESPGSIRMKWTRCPVYEGLAAAGVDHETIGRMCGALSEVECAALSREYPNLSGRLEYRATSDQPCVEEFALAK